jgi:hypothetical protein
LASRQATFTHWRGSPFSLARLLPPSLTPSTARIPRPPLRTARLLAIVIERRPTMMPARLEPTARLRLIKVRLIDVRLALVQDALLIAEEVAHTFEITTSSEASASARSSM